MATGAAMVSNIDRTLYPQMRFFFNVPCKDLSHMLGCKIAPDLFHNINVMTLLAKWEGLGFDFQTLFRSNNYEDFFKKPEHYKQASLTKTTAVKEKV